MPVMSEERAVLVRITGRVQGVWYRGWTVRECQSRGLSGWVRNRSDGTVEALISGPREAVAAMLDVLWEGPSSAFVTGVDFETAKAPEFKGFRQIRGE